MANNIIDLNSIFENNEEYPKIIIGEKTYTVIDTVEKRNEFKDQLQKDAGDYLALYEIAFGSKEKAQEIIDMHLRVKNADTLFIALWGIYNDKPFKEAEQFFRTLTKGKSK